MVAFKMATYPFPTRVARFLKESPLGIGLVEEDNIVSIAEFMPGSAAEQCEQLSPDDRFVKINGNTALQFNLEEVQDALIDVPVGDTLELVVAGKYDVSDAQINAIINNEVTAGDVLIDVDVPDSLKDKTITQVLKEVRPNDPLHKTVKAAIYDITVPLTTRAPRPGEVDGREYHFVDDSDFDRLIKEGKMLEHGEKNGVKYGTLKVDAEIAKSKLHGRRSSQSTPAPGDSNDDAKVLDLMGRAAPQDIANMTIVKFLKTIPVNHKQHGAIRKQVQALVYEMTVPYTTRARREGEKEGREYHFVSSEKFKQLQSENFFIEVGARNDVHYGTPRLTVGAAREKLSTRKEALRKAKGAAAKEATIQDLLKNKGVAVPTNQSASQFLKSTDPSDQDTAGIRAKIKNAIYDLTVPLTTRAPRKGEVNGREYNFVTKEQFESYIEQDQMLEYGTRNGIYYGTLKLSKDELQCGGKPAARRKTMQEALASAETKKADPPETVKEEAEPSVDLEDDDNAWSETLV